MIGMSLSGFAVDRCVCASRDGAGGEAFGEVPLDGGNFVVNMLAPSIDAASSISAGMAAKKPCRIHTANVKLKALLTRISPSRG